MDKKMDKKIYEEIQHGKEILWNAGLIWGLVTSAGKKRAESRAKLLVRFGEIRNDKRILEIGCGTREYSQKGLHN